ncbi:DUF2398 family protein [Kitasatospora sp. CM 4170]|uniref:DUF2398 family protein n=1 Tax=Kitasatospora aburaviensis TaxID=67265 RepID=A0ABW1EQ57_9ACTN|nr:DUF2398 family protein [Kitasatospora sp. CM 4170]WNM48674.1 DUF2398 family protein [Kitasatospora sp. CM 4170]
MEQQEYAAGATQVAGGTADGRTGGAGRSTTDAVAAVRGAGPDAPQVPAPADSADGLSPDPGLLRLSRWFAEADPGTADDLCASSFGLYPARHFGAPAEAAPAPTVPAPTVPEQTAAGAAAGAAAGGAADVSWWHGPTAHAAAALRARETRPARGLRRARRDVDNPPVVRSGAKPGSPGRHRKPERSRGAAAVPPGPAGATGGAGTQDRSAAAAEQRIAARLLLAHPLVTASGPHADGFPLIRRHRDWLTERFDTLLGYRLVVGPWHARLCKAGLGPGATRRLEHPATGEPFTPGGYAQLALVLALLVDAPEQLPLGRLRAAVRAAEPGAVPAAAPGDLAMALAALADWQVLTGVPADPADEDAVLTVDRELARAVPAGPPALAADAADLIHRAAEAEPGTAVRRRLAETPAVLVADLPEDQRAWLREHRHSGPAALAEFLGLEAESRAEGVALLDPAEELTDLVLPGPGTLAHAALLLVERLVEEVRPLPGEPEEDAEAAGGEPAVPVVPVPDALIDGVLGDIADEYGLPAGWRRDYLADRTALRRDALDLLHRMGLITPTPRGTRPPGWLLRAPAARYAPAADLLPTPGTGRHSRRDPAVTIPSPAGERAEQRA